MRRIKRVGLLALTGLALLAMSGCERWSSNLVSSTAPVFSPDGTKVAFSTASSKFGPTDTNGTNDVYVKDALAVFSPDSRKLAYVTWAGAAGDLEADGGPASVYLLDLDTGQIRDISGPSAGGNGPRGTRPSAPTAPGWSSSRWPTIW